MGIFEADAENCGRAGDSASHPGHLELCGAGLCVWLGVEFGQYGVCSAGRGSLGDLLPAKRPYPASDCIPSQPVWITKTGILDAW